MFRALLTLQVRTDQAEDDTVLHLLWIAALLPNAVALVTVCDDLLGKILEVRRRVAEPQTPYWKVPR